LPLAPTQLRHDNKDDLEDLISLLNYITPSQAFFVWFQDFKRDLDHVYFMRTGTETLLRAWFRTKKDRQDFVSETGVEPGEESRKKLFERVEKCFLEQGLEVPEAYRYKTAEEAEVRDRFGFMDFGEKVDQKKEDDINNDKDKKADDAARAMESKDKEAEKPTDDKVPVAGEPPRPAEEGALKME
jgi:hypothetical protein